MIGPTPYKGSSPKVKDVAVDLPDFDGVLIPNKNIRQEFISLSEIPTIEIPSTYDDALLNDELLNNLEIVDANLKEIFPQSPSKEIVAFGIPVPAEVSPLAFGGGFGTKQELEEFKFDGSLSVDETRVLLKNSVIYGGVSGNGANDYELGTKLIYNIEQQEKLDRILSTQYTPENLDTQIVPDAPLFVVGDPPTIIDGGDF
jgi:hypothetical protein